MNNEKNMNKPDKIIDVKTNEDLEQIEEDIIEAADKAGKRNVIVNIFAVPGARLKRRWNIRYKFNKKHLIMDIIIALSVLFIIGLNIFWAYGGFHYFFNRLDLSAQISGEKVESGSISEIIIEYGNRNKFEIEEAVLSLTFPKYFILESVDRENYDTHNNVLVLGDLAPGANGKVVIKGKIFGNIDEQQAIFASINYFKTDKKGNRLWGQFRKNNILEFKINSSPLGLTPSIVSSDVIRGQMIVMGVKVKNNSESNEYKKLTLNLIGDEEIQIKSNESLEVLNLKPGEEREFRFDYVINTDKKDKNVKVELHWLDPQWDLVQAILSNDFKVTDQKFIFNQEIVNKGPVNPGDWVEIILDYENAGEFTLHDVSLNITFQGDYWDLTQIDSAGGSLLGAGPKSLKWSADTVPALALLQPGQTGKMKIKVKTKNYVFGSSDFNLQTILISNNNFNGNNVEIESTPSVIKLNSNLAVQVYPMYYAPTGDQLGRGPLPPKVGEATKYWVFAKLINDISPVENVVLTMDLPLNVSWSNRSNVPVGDPLIYDPNSRTISWKVTKLPVKPSNIGFAFEVSLIPGTNQIGQYPVLIQDIRISGRDERTGSLIERNLGNITSKLIQDTKGKTKDGIVR